MIVSGGTPASFAATTSAEDPASSTYSTYFGFPAYTLDAKSGYPMNSGAGLPRLAVGFRTGDHTGSSVPVTAEGPGAFLLYGRVGYLLQDGGHAIHRYIGRGQTRGCHHVRQVSQDHRQMMQVQVVLMGVLLTAGPVFSQFRPMTILAFAKGCLVWFDLTETMAADAGDDYLSWQYQIGVADHDDFSHVLVFRKPAGALVSITRNYDPER